MLVVLMLASISVNYISGIAMASVSKKKLFSRIILVTAITINLSFLFYYKYFNFFISNLLAVNIIKPSEYQNVILPIGISFFTFQSISYLIDVYRKKTSEQRNPFNLGLYIALFPQLIAGPIIRYHDIAQQIVQRTITTKLFTQGLIRFIRGLAKKIIIANTAALIADRTFALGINELPASVAWLGIICYTFQIYFDFSGYSDMAIGLGKMLGFNYKENFNYPYISQSIREFWTRWHISLTSWFRDYLFLPLALAVSGKFKSNKVFNIKSDVCIYIISMTVTWYLIGLWHGASWNFVAWGLFNGFFIVVERFFYSKRLKKVYRPFRHIYTLLIITIAWVFFRIENLTESFEYLKCMAGFSNGDNYSPVMLLDNYKIFVLIMGIVFSMPVIPWLERNIQKLFSQKRTMMLASKYMAYTAYILLFIFSLMELAQSGYNPFIYFRF
ncbi:MBOAT family O-acyltransferase [candidate division KSB1 bacterium]